MAKKQAQDELRFATQEETEALEKQGRVPDRGIMAKNPPVPKVLPDNSHLYCEKCGASLASHAKSGCQ